MRGDSYSCYLTHLRFNKDDARSYHEWMDERWRAYFKYRNMIGEEAKVEQPMCLTQFKYLTDFCHWLRGPSGHAQEDATGK